MAFCQQHNNNKSNKLFKGTHLSLSISLLLPPILSTSKAPLTLLGEPKEKQRSGLGVGLLLLLLQLFVRRLPLLFKLNFSYRFKSYITAAVLLSHSKRVTYSIVNNNNDNNAQRSNSDINNNNFCCGTMVTYSNRNMNNHREQHLNGVQLKDDKPLKDENKQEMRAREKHIHSK